MEIIYSHQIIVAILFQLTYLTAAFITGVHLPKAIDFECDEQADAIKEQGGIA